MSDYLGPETAVLAALPHNPAGLGLCSLHPPPRQDRYSSLSSPLWRRVLLVIGTLAAPAKLSAQHKAFPLKKKPVPAKMGK